MKNLQTCASYASLIFVLTRIIFYGFFGSSGQKIESAIIQKNESSWQEIESTPIQKNESSLRQKIESTVRKNESSLRQKIETTVQKNQSSLGQNIISTVEKNESSSGQNIISTIQKNESSSGQKVLPFCTRSELRTGQWIKSTDKPPYGLGGSVCANKSFNISDVYDWQPEAHESCRFEKFNKTKFCSLMKEAPILIFGDSLSFEHFGSLVESLGGKVSRELQFRKRHNFIGTQSVCSDNRTFVMFRRQDGLEGLKVFVRKKFPVVIVMNRGAHYVEDDVLASGLTSTFQEVANWQQQCVEYGIKCHFFWRTTVPGHPKCGEFLSPVNNISLMEKMVANDKVSIFYNWDKFKAQNELALRLLESSNVTNYEVIDAYHINILRPDQHLHGTKDCLHSCRPGKIEVYNQLIQHVLMQKRTKKDVEKLENFNFPWNRTRNIRPDGQGVLFFD